MAHQRRQQHPIAPESGADADAVVITRVRRRVPAHTTWTFKPSIELVGPIDVMTLLDRDGEDDELCSEATTPAPSS